MSEFQRACRERAARIDAIAADNVRRGMSPADALVAATQAADDDAAEAATGHRPLRVIPMTVGN